MTDTTILQVPQRRSKGLQRDNRTKFFESKFFWIVLVLILFSLPLVLSFRRPPVPVLPILGQMSDFQLTNQDGKPFSSKDVQGSVLLVNFIFTRCPDVCPTLTREMAQVEERLRGTAKSIQLLSVSVDPTFDKPAVLKDYAQKYNADFSLWNFLTGSPQEVRRLVVESFKAALVTEPSNDKNDMTPGFEIAHSEHFVLVDQLGRIRAYKHLETTADINQLMKDFAVLVNTPPKI